MNNTTETKITIRGHFFINRYTVTITRDNVTVKVNAVVYFRVVDPEDAVVKVLDYVRATSLIGQCEPPENATPGR